MDLLGLSYLGLDVTDVGAWRRFGTEVIGLMPAVLPPETESADLAYLKADDRQWRIALHAADTPGLRYAGFEVGSEAGFATAAESLLASGGWTRGTDAECAHRAVRDLVWAVDPSGVRVEVCWGPTRDGGFVSPAGVPRFVTGELGLGHFVVLTPDLDASLDFYAGTLGLRLSDYVIIGEGMSVQFLRCNARHHSVALTAVGPIAATHHIALEVDDIDQVGAALERATRAGHPITATLGRHKNDRMLSFYMRSPAGFEVEIGCDGRLVDERTWVVNHFTGGDDWGHHGLTGDSLAESVEAQ